MLSKILQSKVLLFQCMVLVLHLVSMVVIWASLFHAKQHHLFYALKCSRDNKIFLFWHTGPSFNSSILYCCVLLYVTLSGRCKWNSNFNSVQHSVIRIKMLFHLDYDSEIWYRNLCNRVWYSLICDYDWI